METKVPSRLEDHLGYWLRLLSNQVSGAFAGRLAAKSIAVGEWVVLRELYDGALAPSALAARLGMTRGAISKLADKLEARKLLRRAADDRDGRGQMLALTPSGRLLVPQLAAMADANDADFFSALTAAERTGMMNLLRRAAARKSLDRHVPIR